MVFSHRGHRAHREKLIFLSMPFYVIASGGVTTFFQRVEFRGILDLNISSNIATIEKQRII